jgi:ERCC4-type nuclease
MNLDLCIIADDRESKVTPHFTNIFSYKQYKFKWVIKRLVHADYIIICNGKLIAMIERKRWGDLASSIKDKRILNIENLKIFRERTQCRLIVLMEGNRPPREGKKRGIPYTALRAKLDHLIWRDNIQIDYSTNQKGTAIRLAELMKNYLTCAHEIPSPQDLKEHESAIQEITGLKEQCKAIIAGKVEKESIMGWCALPGVDMVTTGLIRRAGYSLGEIIQGKLDANELSLMKYPGTDMKIGIERAMKILRDSIKKETNMAILCSIRGVTKEIAVIIMDDFQGTLKNVVEEGSIVYIASLKRKKGKCRAIGRKVAERILNTLNNKLIDTDASDASDNEE